MSTISGMHRCGAILPPGTAVRAEAMLLFDRLDPAALTLEVRTEGDEWRGEYTFALDLLVRALHQHGILFGHAEGNVRVRLVGGTVTLLLRTPRGDVVLAMATEWVRVMVGQIALCAGSLADQGAYYDSLIESELTEFLRGKK